MTLAPATPDLHEEVDRFLHGLWRFNRALTQRLEPLLETKHGIDPKTYIILKSIDSGHHYPKVLADHLKIPSTLISRYLDGLVKQGLLERHIDEHDSRRIRLTLTEHGTNVMHDSEETIHVLTRSHLAKLEPGVLAGLLKALDSLNDQGPDA
ncbi:MarR family winged helix-turn-helix transcriptional regulator [Deinococcus yavapaiensis]|uniref:MarR family transcriptional regulator n=1 Tax=Deinococcus yavapaiensis KR-236 TaxID=694435 RepID=A0A318S399_9DEIO|nr:MarR family winged helix-turn-helix transcriptional regulator [Deinococcus yavapaiensis]PYE50577.1 MarR family transcriptional regulator [Deinococcus yavapaiensis KR-236]